MAKNSEHSNGNLAINKVYEQRNLLGIMRRCTSVLLLPTAPLSRSFVSYFLLHQCSIISRYTIVICKIKKLYHEEVGYPVLRWYYVHYSI